MNSIEIGTFKAKEIPTLDYYDLIGGKLAALFARHKSRDLFDIYTIFTKGKELDLEKIKLAFLVYCAGARIDLRKINLEHIDFELNDLKNMLLPVLRQQDLQATNDLKTWVTKLITTCKNSLAEIMKFNNNELSFLDNILDAGNIVPELITQETALMQAIKTNPVLLWKVNNVKK